MLLFCAARFHCVCDVLSCCEVVVKHGFVTTRAAFPFTPRDTVKVSARGWGMGI